MVHALVRFDLEDHDSWKDAFEERRAVRAENGCRGERLFARSNNERKVVLLAEWDSRENADAYFDGADFRDAMRSAGVARKPDVTFLDPVEDVSVVTPEQDATEDESVAREPTEAESTDQESSERPERESSSDEPEQ